MESQPFELFLADTQHPLQIRALATSQPSRIIKRRREADRFFAFSDRVIWTSNTLSRSATRTAISLRVFSLGVDNTKLEIDVASPWHHPHTVELHLSSVVGVLRAHPIDTISHQHLLEKLPYMLVRGAEVKLQLGRDCGDATFVFLQWRGQRFISTRRRRKHVLRIACSCVSISHSPRCRAYLSWRAPLQQSPIDSHRSP